MQLQTLKVKNEMEERLETKTTWQKAIVSISEMYVALLIGSMKNDIRDVCSTADWHLGIPKILGDTQNFGFTRNIG